MFTLTPSSESASTTITGYNTLLYIRHACPCALPFYLMSDKQVFRVKKLVGRRGAPELELLAVVIVLFAPILHESLTNSNFAMLFINITVFKDVCKRVSFVG